MTQAEYDLQFSPLSPINEPEEWDEEADEREYLESVKRSRARDLFELHNATDCNGNCFSDADSGL